MPQRISNFTHIVSHDKEIWRISVRLSDRSEVTQHKINFIKIAPSGILTHDLLIVSLMYLPTVLGRNGRTCFWAWRGEILNSLAFHKQVHTRWCNRVCKKVTSLKNSTDQKCHLARWNFHLVMQKQVRPICWSFLKWVFFYFMHHFTCCTLFISRINRTWFMIHTGN